MERRQELEAKQEEARRRLEEAKKTREGTEKEGWFERRLEGRRQEKQARQAVEDAGEKLKELPSGHALKEEIGERIQSLDEKGRQQLGKALSPTQAKLASAAVGAARKAAERTMGQERDRDRGMGM